MCDKGCPAKENNNCGSCAEQAANIMKACAGGCDLKPEPNCAAAKQDCGCDSRAQSTQPLKMLDYSACENGSAKEAKKESCGPPPPKKDSCAVPGPAKQDACCDSQAQSTQACQTLKMLDYSDCEDGSVKGAK